jgi:hypothetical protein
MGKLIPIEILETIPALYETEGSLNPLCQVKLFTPDSNWTWYIIEISEDKDYCFGYVIGLESELGYFTLSEIESARGSLGLQVERDLSFTPTSFATIKQNEQ